MLKSGATLPRWLCLLSALAIASLAAPISAASANSSTSPFAVIEDCRERAVLVPGVEKLVRERVPAQFELVRDPLGRPLLVVDGARCERIAIDDTAKPSSFALFLAVIESPDGAGCLSRWPAVGGVKPDLLPTCNFYAFFSAHSNQAVVTGTRAVAPDAPIYHVRNLAFEEGEFDLTRLGAPYGFRAPRPTPSPFELDGVVRDGLVENPLTITFWDVGSSGPERIRIELENVAIGHLDARLRPAPGSEMSELLGTETPKPITGLALHYPYGEIYAPSGPGAPAAAPPPPLNRTDPRP